MSAPPRFQLDAYRAIAASVVVVFHAYQFNRRPPVGEWPMEGTYFHGVMIATDLAVSLFFVLSGFLLGTPYARTCIDGGPPRSARGFLLRRLVRIVPLYYIVVLTVWCLTNPKLPGDWRDLLQHLTFTHVYSQDKIFYTDGPAWSLADEVHFYLLLAVLGALAQRVCRRLHSRRARISLLLGGIAVLIGVSAAYKLWALYVLEAPKDAWPVWFGPLAKLDIFAVGLLLAVAGAAGVRLQHRLTRVVTTLGGFGVLALALSLRPPHNEPDPFVHSVVAVGCALLVASTALSGGPQPRWLSWRPLVVVGLSSYSLYLWHEPVLRVLSSWGLLPDRLSPLAFPVTAGLLLAVAIPLAWASFHMLERTAMQIQASFDADGKPVDYYRGTAAGVP